MRKQDRPCTCAAYPFPHRPSGGRCMIHLAAQAVRERFWRFTFDRSELEELSRDFNVVDPIDIANVVYSEVLA